MRLLLLLFALFASSFGQLFGRGYQFAVGQNSFLLNGRTFRYVSGSIHYFRIHPSLWNDRLAKVRALGLNAITFFVPWNFHEDWPGRYNFRGDRDLSRFLRLAQQNDLYVLLRIGPFVGGGWEFGGLPWWLLRTRGIRLRTSDYRFTNAVQRWYNVLFNVVRPHLLKNGGNIIMVQLENEYGSFSACDRYYMSFLRDTARYGLGSDVQLYTTDNIYDRNLQCGPIDGALLTIDFGPGTKPQLNSYMAQQRRYRPWGPPVNSEFYPGWKLNWGQDVHHEPTLKSVLDGSKYMFYFNASFNYYMIHGGTTFGFWAGSQPNNAPITSYDYDAPISEAGDTTAKYYALQQWTNTIRGWWGHWDNTPRTPPPNRWKVAYGGVALRHLGSPVQLRNVIGRNCMSSHSPMTFEDMNHPYGFALYEAVLRNGGRMLYVNGIKDHGYVMVNGQYQGAIYSNFLDRSQNSMWLYGAGPGSRLQILVENRGRVFYNTFNDFKGIIGSVQVDGVPVINWSQCGIEPTAARWNSAQRGGNPARGPNIYMGTFRGNGGDTFFDPTGWGKGQLYINGVNLGRYWPMAGPQIALYVPQAILQPVNTIVVLELLGTSRRGGNGYVVNFIDRPYSYFRRPADPFASP